jgi:hypothetical protein
LWEWRLPYAAVTFTADLSLAGIHFHDTEFYKDLINMQNGLCVCVGGGVWVGGQWP